MAGITESTRTGRNGMALPLGSRATACTRAQSVGWGWAWVVHSNVVVWLRVEPHPGARAATRMTSGKRNFMRWTPIGSCYRPQPAERPGGEQGIDRPVDG